MKARTLKIEMDGDFWKGKIRPKIRLKGSWLAQAGFSPGHRVSVISLAPGVIELRSDEIPSARQIGIARQMPLPLLSS